VGRFRTVGSDSVRSGHGGTFSKVRSDSVRSGHVEGEGVYLVQ